MGTVDTVSFDGEGTLNTGGAAAATARRTHLRVDGWHCAH